MTCVWWVSKLTYLSVTDWQTIETVMPKADIKTTKTEKNIDKGKHKTKHQQQNKNKTIVQRK